MRNSNRTHISRGQINWRAHKRQMKSAYRHGYGVIDMKRVLEEIKAECIETGQDPVAVSYLNNVINWL